MAEIIFSNNDVNTDNKKFAILLQAITTEHAESIQDIIQMVGTSEDAYAKAKSRLIQTYPESATSKLDKLLTGAEIPIGLKPSAILTLLKIERIQFRPTKLSDKYGLIIYQKTFKKPWLLAKIPSQKN
jgi:hypothetical protein